MIDPSLAEVVRSIHASPWRLVVAVTGGGSGALAALLQTPGASRTVLEAVVPYAHVALVEWLGGPPDQACSAETARAMAMAALMRSRHLAPDADPRRLIGVGCTASLASDRPKHGEHRVHVAVQAAEDAWSYSLTLAKGRRDRGEEELIAAELVVRSIAMACGDEAQDQEALLSTAGADEQVNAEHQHPPAAVVALLLGERACAALKPGSMTDYYDPAESPRLAAVFPGAFNPPHRGHLGMAAEAERRLGLPVAWELSIANVDKPPLDFFAIQKRVAGLRSEDGKRLAALTCAATFREKAELFPGTVFVVGADTLVRIGDERYYGADTVRRDAAVAAIANQGCRFLVFGREIAGRFHALGDLSIPVQLRLLCDEVPASEFREDVSSRALRGGA